MLSSKELNKFYYLTGEDLGYKPGVAKEASFDYSLLGKVFNKDWKKKAKKKAFKKNKKYWE